MTRTTEMAKRILQATRDGDELHATDLALLECAVNGILNAAGIDKFKELHYIVENDKYNIKERWT